MAARFHAAAVRRRGGRGGRDPRHCGRTAAAGGSWRCVRRVVMHARWLALLGDGAYTATLWLNRYFNTARRRLGYPYWSLSAYLKRRVKNATQYIGSFADAVADEARRRGVEGVVCGHIHHAELREIGGILYCNSGDWVESCTALVEHYDGRLELIDWIDRWALDPRTGRGAAVVE